MFFLKFNLIDWTKVLLQSCTRICDSRRIASNEFVNNGNATQNDINADCWDF